MDNLIKLRNGLKARINKILTIVNKHYTTDPLDIFKVQFYLNQLAEHHAEINAIQKQLFQEHCEDDAATETQADVCEWFDGKVCEIKKKLLEIQILLKPEEPTPGTSTGTGNSQCRETVKLPKIEIPTFHGKHEDWTSFADLFLASVHSNSTLSGAQKLQYLKGAVKGEASNLIKSFQITDSNYSEAWKTLKERYDNQREITQAILRRIFNQPFMTKESSSGLQKLLDTTNECIRSLTVLGRPVEHWDDMLVYMVVDRMDPESRRQWALTFNGTLNPKFSELSEFITQYVRGLTASESGSKNQPSGSRASSNGGDRKQASSHHSYAEAKCTICHKKGHSVSRCFKLKSMSPVERGNACREGSLCLNCLKPGHRTLDCKNEKCSKCGKPHHFLLHSGSGETQEKKPEETVSLFTSGGEVEDTQVLLSTAEVTVEDRFGNPQLVRVLLDTGSQASLITEVCANRLGLKREKSDVIIRGISAAKVGSVRGKLNISVSSCVEPGPINVEVLILPKVTGTLPRFPCKKSWTHLEGIYLADPHYYRPGSIDILLGADVVASIMRSGRRTGPPNSPIAQDSLFGWILSGVVSTVERPTILLNHVHCETESILKRFWELEEMPPIKHFTNEEKECESKFQNTHSRDLLGRFVVQLPLSQPLENLGSSRETAIRRWKQVERRLEKFPDYKKQYTEFMDEYLSLNHMEQVLPKNVSSNHNYYLPHHFVLKEDSSTTKLRVVFDGSTKTSSGISLNDCLMVGPTIQDDLFTLLLRFRCHVIALKADVSKMYRQFRVSDQDAEFQRIVWRRSPDHPIQDFKLLTLTYGTASAAYLATRCLKQLAESGREDFPLASHVLSNDFYVDDLLGGESTRERALELQQQLCSLLKCGGMELRKWSCSDPTVLENIPPDLREKSSSLSFDTDSTLKALGVKWNPTSNFVFEVLVPERPKGITKRVVLSELAKVFDPLGWLAPTTIRAKILFQDLWKLTIGWDEEIPENVKVEWLMYQKELPVIRSICIPRCIIFPKSVSQQFHGYCDASEKAYAAVVYLRSELSDGSVKVRLVTSKTKVAPIKQVSLPRLELCGAVLLCNLVKTIQSATKLKGEVYLWTDSTIVIRWLSAFPGRWKTFVANRVSEIQDSFPSEHWHHVPSEQNPADCASRGINANELQDFSLWWNGPSWLLSSSFPVFPHVPDMQNVQLEEKKKVELVNQVCVEESLVTQFSNLNKLKRVTAYCFRFIQNVRRRKEDRRGGNLTCEEIEESFFHWIRHSQESAFSDDLKALKLRNQVSATSKLRMLCPFIDLRGILRVGGRLQKAQAPENQKHQIILPHHHPLTKLIIDECHLKNLHAGFQLLWSTLQRNFWILRARDVIRNEIRNSIICRKQRAETAQQLMGSLPTPRVTPGFAFEHCGLDYAGPYHTRLMKGRSTKSFKCYFCIFVCLSTKAVHLEPVSDLTTESFIGALKRFTGRRGVSSHLYSDCGTNFVGADKELKTMLTSSQHNSDVSHFLLEKGTTWHFNPPSAPHQGGLWEAGVKSVKFHLKRVMGNALLTFEEFTTVLCQVESCLNSRPLCAMSTDPADYDVLTPGHFLIRKPLNAIPEGDLTSIKTNRLSRWQRSEQIVQHFWKRWSVEYLSTLQQRFKWTAKRTDLQVGDLVLIRDDNLPPNKWRLGRITQVHPGADSLVRVVTVKTMDGELKRPIVKLCPILFHDE